MNLFFVTGDDTFLKTGCLFNGPRWKNSKIKNALFSCFALNINVVNFWKLSKILCVVMQDSENFTDKSNTDG